METMQYNEFLANKDIQNVANSEMLSALKCALAALSQYATYPADIALAKNVIKSAIEKVEGRTK